MIDGPSPPKQMKPNQKGGSLAALYWALTEEHQWTLAGGALSMLAVNLLELVPPIVLGRLIDSLTKAPVGGFPTTLMAAYVAVLSLQALLRYPLRSGFIGTSIRIAAGLRERFASRVLRVSRSSLSAYSTGDLMSRMSSDLGLVEGAVATGLPFLCDCSIYLLILPAAMMSLSPTLALAAFVALPVIPILAATLIPRISRASDIAQEAFARLVSRAHENAVAAQTVRAYGLETRESESFLSSGTDYVSKDLRRARLETLFSGSVQALVAVSISIALGLGSRQAIAGELTAGRFVTFLQYAGMMAWPLTGLAWAFLLFRKGTVGLRRLEEILSLPDEASGGLQAPEGEGSIEVRDLTYSRPGESSSVLSNVSLRLNPGERVALIGPLGSGKTTLIHLLTRVIEPPVGSMWMDGVDVTTLDLVDFRLKIAVAPQESFLFSGTIRENIQGASSDPETVLVAAQAARVEGAEFRLGLDTPAGEKGALLSGGQRQRVAVARALTRGARILLLDDATSALDHDTERQLFEGLGKGTVLFSTHRSSLARRADRIVVLVEGRIVEEGRPEELLAAGGFFSSMAKKESFSKSFDHV